MPIYTAEEVSGQAKPTLALRDRGLNMKNIPLSRLNPFAVPLVFQPVYKQYIQNIEAFMSATARKTVVSLTDLPLKLSLDSSKHIPLQSPPVVFTFARKLSTEENEALKQKGVEELPVKKKDELSVYRTSAGVMNSELIKFITSHSAKVNLSAQTVFGQANIKGYLSFLKARTIITIFLATQYYPAFRETTKESTIEAKQFFSMTRKTYEGMEDEESVAKRARIEKDGDDVDEMDIESYWEDMKVAKLVIDDVIPRAHPPAIEYQGYGPTANAPTTAGNVFPYFDGLVDDDTNYVSSTIIEYFLLCLSDSRAGCSSEAGNLKGGLGQFAGSPIGRALTHIFCGIRLAIQAQTQLYLHLAANGHYSGFSLHGANYSINIFGRQYLHENAKEVAKDLQSVDEHGTAVAKLLQIIAKKEKSMKLPTVKRKVADITSPRALYLAMKELVLDDDEKKGILELAGKMSFPQTFWRMSVRNLLSAITYLVDGVEPPSDAPMYIGQGNILTSNQHVSVFALFGELGFSFKAPGGARFILPDSKDKDELFKPYKDPKTKREVKPMRTFVIMKKGHLSCALDWKEFTLDRVLVLKPQRSAAFKSEVIGGPPAKEFWYGLIDRIPKLMMSGGPSVDEVELDGDKSVPAREDDLDDLSSFW